MLNAIKEHALRESPKECCGVLVGSRIIPCSNLSRTPETEFIIGPKETKKIEAQIGKITGFYHSHFEKPDFSTADILISEKLRLESYLYIIKTDKLLNYKPEGNPIPFEGRPFILGLFDCLVLTIDYYKRILNINLKEYDDPRRYDENWVNEPENFPNNDFFANFFREQGFVDVDIPQKHDLILTKIGNLKGPIHCLVYLGNNKILSHYPYRISTVEDYSILQKKKTCNILRHKTRI